MSPKSQLPVPLNDTYFEPISWRMSRGLVYVSVLTAAERMDPQFVRCMFVAKTATGVIKGAFEFVSDSLTELTTKGYDIVWQLARGEQINLSCRDDDG